MPSLYCSIACRPDKTAVKMILMSDSAEQCSALKETRSRGGNRRVARGWGGGGLRVRWGWGERKEGGLGGEEGGVIQGEEKTGARN